MKIFNPKEFKVVALRECPVPGGMLVRDTPEHSAASFILGNTKPDKVKL